MAPSLPPIPASRYHRVDGRGSGKGAALAAVLGALLLACSARAADPARSATIPDPPTTTSTSTLAASTAPAPTATPGDRPDRANRARSAPDWLGRRTLPTGPDGRVEVPQTTPAELRDRRLVTVDHLPPPPSEAFVSTIEPVPADVLARSTWSPDCPVTPDDLAYVTVAFWGFDGQPHTGELLVGSAAASDIVAVLEQLHRARFPIEEMRVVTRADLEARPTGDGNNTTAFVCRAVTGGTSFSQHAYGLAIDLNPFHNPYQRQQLVLPELAGAYLDRERPVPGMVLEGGPVVEAFEQIGWWWGGRWRSLKDYQHFSHNNR